MNIIGSLVRSAFLVARDRRWGVEEGQKARLLFRFVVCDVVGGGKPVGKKP